MEKRRNNSFKRTDNRQRGTWSLRTQMRCTAPESLLTTDRENRSEELKQWKSMGTEDQYWEE